MAIGAIVTLALLGAALVAFGVILWVCGGKLKFPKGTRYEATLVVGSSAILKTHLVLTGNISFCDTRTTGDGIALRCCEINKSVRAAFGRFRMLQPAIASTAKEIVVWVMDESTYVKSGGTKMVAYLAKTVAHVRHCERRFWGDFAPMICIKIDAGAVLSENGEPLIHELCHVYRGDYVADSDDHSDEKIWIGAGHGRDTVQFLAREMVLSRKI